VRVDYHVHTDNSYDCKTPMIEMCARAVQNGLSAVAFTDHLNNHLLDVDLGYYDPARYFDDIDYCRAKFPNLTILAGVEVGEPHRWHRKVQPILERYPYDIVLGSLHWVGRDSMFNANFFRSRPPEEAYRAYFSELVTMIEHGGFDVLAHADLPKRVGYDVYGSFESRTYETELRKVWQACLDHNIIPEINTKSLRMNVGRAHPDDEALRWYAEMGGQGVSVGSDAHNTGSLGFGTKDALHSALQCGLSGIVQFRQRELVGWTKLVES